jgi:protein-S-isoprenylcysteine O-methyltransferase Ste14
MGCLQDAATAARAFVLVFATALCFLLLMERRLFCARVQALFALIYLALETIRLWKWRCKSRTMTAHCGGVIAPLWVCVELLPWGWESKPQPGSLFIFGVLACTTGSMLTLTALHGAPNNFLVSHGAYTVCRRPLRAGCALIHVGLASMAAPSARAFVAIMPVWYCVVSRKTISQRERLLERRYGVKSLARRNFIFDLC